MSRPDSSVSLQNGTSRSPFPLSNTASLDKHGQGPQKDDTIGSGYFQGSTKGLVSDTRQRPELVSVSRKLSIIFYCTCDRPVEKDAQPKSVSSVFVFEMHLKHV